MIDALDAFLIFLLGDLNVLIMEALLRAIGCFYMLIALGYTIAFLRSYQFFKNSYHHHYFHIFAVLGWAAAGYFTIFYQAIYAPAFIFIYALWGFVSHIIVLKVLGSSIIVHFKIFKMPEEKISPVYKRLIARQKIEQVLNALFTANVINDKILWLAIIVSSLLGMRFSYLLGYS